jgi:uncharacterized protein YjdB
VSSTDFATIDADGLLTAKGNGLVLVRATANDGSNKYGSLPVIIIGQDVTPIVPATGVAISNAPAIFKYKATGAKTKQLTATVAPANATVNTVIWTSNNESVATVDLLTGLVTFVGPEGQASITAMAAGINSLVPVTDTKIIKVVKNATKIRTPLNTVYLTKGKTLTLPIEIDDGKTNITAATAKTFKSSKPKIVTVSNKGKLKAIKAGSSNITVKTASGKSLKIKVVVAKKPTKLKKFTISGVPKSSSLVVGGTAQLKIKLTPAKATNQKVSFSSSNKKIITVDKAGKLTAAAKGKAKISVKVGTVTVKTKYIWVI